MAPANSLTDGSSNMIAYLNTLSGGAFSNATLFAMGITPYINSSIIIQLLCVAIPALERLTKEGEAGRRKDRHHHTLRHRSARTDPGYRILLLPQEHHLHSRGRLLRQAHHRLQRGLLDGIRGHRYRARVHSGYRSDDVARRADQQVRHRQRYLNAPVCGHHRKTSRYRPHPRGLLEDGSRHRRRGQRSGTVLRICHPLGSHLSSRSSG